MRIQIEEVFYEVADLSAKARARYFAEHNIDARTRTEVEELLAFDSNASALLEKEISIAAERAVNGFDFKGSRCGPYELGKLLGRGGMGTVHSAERVDGEVSQRVAVKLLRPGADDVHSRQRFLAERQILAGLSHPN